MNIFILRHSFIVLIYFDCVLDIIGSKLCGNYLSEFFFQSVLGNVHHIIILQHSALQEVCKKNVSMGSTTQPT